MISQRAKYALRALLALARRNLAGPGGVTPIAAIAESEGVPRKFLEQILLDLSRQGFVESRRGAAGGYRLLRDADAITLTDILRAVDGPIAPLPCLSVTAYRRCDDCVRETACTLRRAFAPAVAAQRAALDGVTLASALGRRGRHSVR